MLLLGLGLALAAPAQPVYDTVIRNGWIIDGTGNPGYKGEIGITDGRVAKIGFHLGEGKQTIDAGGKVVAPGFIDVHTHAENVVSVPLAENFVRMGVTTIVIGNCGGSESNISAFLNGLERKPVSVNVATLVGHNTVRRAAMGGNFDRVPSGEEAKKMAASVDQAMKDGAVGLSTGLIYQPGIYSETSEIVDLAKVVAQYDGIYATHMRSEGTNIMAAVEEMCRVGIESGCRVEYSHIKLSGENMWGKTADVMGLLTKAREKGLEITQDQYAYTASSTSISTLLPDDAMEGGANQFKKRLADPQKKAAMAQDMTRRLNLRNRTDYAYAVIASCGADKRLNGKNLVEAAQIRLGKSTLEDQIETVFWICANGGASAVFHGMSEDDIRAFMRDQNTMVASDSSCRDFGVDVPHPRGYGNNARVLGRYVRELRVVTLQDAVRKMTSLPAQTFRLQGKGAIRQGMDADIVIFDPQTVTDPSTYDKPHAYATGFSAVLVRGVPVVRNDKHTGSKPGWPIRREGWVPGDRTNLLTYVGSTEAEILHVACCP